MYGGVHEMYNAQYLQFVNVNSMKKNIEKTAESCYNENNNKLKATERRFFMEQIAIFCDADDFCRAYEEYCRNKLLMDKEEVVPRTRISLSEIMTILIMYHLSGYKNFKCYYTKYVMVHQRKDYPDLVSYNRFVEIMKFALASLI